MKLSYNRETGWGNTIIQVADFLFACSKQKKVPHLPEPIPYVEGISISTDPEEEVYKANIYINNVTFNYVHPIMRQFVIPSPEMTELLRQNEHGCSVGLHIRRGNYGPDSKALDDGTPHHDAAWFCDDATLQKFIQVIENSPEPVFVCTDSIHLKNELLEKYPEKVRVSNVSEIIHSRACDGADTTGMFIDWFLLSQCKKVYITAGDTQMKGFSTFGYTAAVYGGAEVAMVFKS
jgi:hypothetical protein